MEAGTGTLTFRGHTGVVESVQLNTDGRRLVSCSPTRGEVKIWDLTRHPDNSTLVRTAGIWIIRDATWWTWRFTRTAGTWFP